MTPLLLLTSLAVILSGSLTIAAHYLRLPRPILIHVFKPLTGILLVATALVPGTFRADPYARLIGLGLLFSLFGDVWLMLPRDRFLYGLVSFLLAHACYIFAFLTPTPAYMFVLAALPLSVIGAIVLAYLWPGLPARLKGAVGFYVVVIVLMATLAASRAMSRLSTGTLLAAIGAFLFLASDAVLAIERFRRRFRLARASVLGSYFAGQLMIALSVGVPAP